MQIPFKNCLIEVDPEAVRKEYDQAFIDWCQCDGCSNWHMVRDRFVPDEVKNFLAQFGLRLGDAQPPLDRVSKLKAPPGHYTYEPCFVLPALATNPLPKTPLYFTRKHFVLITAERTETEKANRTYQLPGISEPILYIRTVLTIPWLFGEVRKFRQVEEGNCIECGNGWRYIGKLKSKSRIPEWYGWKIEGKFSNYEAAFCWHCGYPELRAVTE